MVVARELTNGCVPKVAATKGKPTTAAIRPFHHAMGVPTSSKISVTIPARRTVSQMACSSLSFKNMP